MGVRRQSPSDIELSRRAVLKLTCLAGTLALTGLLAACGGGGASETATEPPSEAGTLPTPTPSAAEAPAGSTPESDEEPDSSRMGGIAKIALYSEPPTLDSSWTTAIVVVVPSHHVFEYLFAYDSQWASRPMLAESFEASADGTTYTITLRSGVKFHNGKEMEAEDVVASLNRWGLVAGEGKATYERVDEVTALDATTVQISLTTPFAPLINYLTGPAGGGAIIMPREQAEAAGTERLEEYIGTGPYQFVEHIPDRHIRVTRFDDYSPRSEPPDAYAGRRTAYFDEIQFIAVPDAAARVAGIETGDYHWAEEVTRDEFDRLQDSDEVDVIVIKPLRFQGIIFNKKQGPMQNTKLRQAVLAALDCEEIMAAAFGPPQFWRVDPSLMPPESVWYSEAGKDKYNQKNLDLAQQLIEESGYNGETIRWMAPADREDYFAVALTGIQQLQAIGLNVELVSMDWGALVNQRTQPESYEIFNTGFSFTPEPTTLSFIPDDWPGWWASDAKTEALSAVMEEIDPTERKALWDAFQELFYEEVPVIKTGDFFGLSIKRKELKGENIGISSFPAFWNQWLET